MARSIVTFVTAILLAAGVQAQTRQSEEMAYRVKDQAFNHSQVEGISHFITDKLGSRLAASKQKMRAEKLVTDTLKSFGFDNVHTEFAFEFTKGGWDNEKNYVAMTAPYYCSFAANPKAWSGSTDGLVTGDCILLEATDTTSLSNYRGKLHGKIVIMPIAREYELSFRPMAKRYTDEELSEMTKDNRPSNPWGRWSYGSNKGLQQAIDSLIKAERPLAVIVGDGTFNIPGSRGVNYKVGDPEPVPEIVLPTEDHGRMVRLLKGGDEVKMELDVRNNFTDNQKINNIIAEIPGTEPKLKNEVVLIGAHLDSWHGGTGGADNGSGCITMIEAMRILKALDINRVELSALLCGVERNKVCMVQEAMLTISSTIRSKRKSYRNTMISRCT